MDDENRRINELEQKLLGIIRSQAALIETFMNSTQRRLDKHKERLDTHRQDLDELKVKIEDLDANKQDCPDEHDERSRIAQEERAKLEAEQMAEEKALYVRTAISEILDRVEALEAGIPDSDEGEGLIEQLAQVRKRITDLEKAIRGRVK